MSREQIYHAVILKKQPYGEGDELITVYSRQTGKLRVMAKSTKFIKSRLQYSLQALFYVRLTVSGRSLPKIIGVEVNNTFSNIRENLTAAVMALYAEELVLKFVPDEEQNETLFGLLITFFEFLDGAGQHPYLLPWALEKFKIDFLEALGFGVAYQTDPFSGPLGFSNSKGGFVCGKNAVDVVPVSLSSYNLFLQFRSLQFGEFMNGLMKQQPINESLAELSGVVSSFLRYQLERDIKSEQYLSL